LFHHPREEVLFEKLKKRDQSVCDAVEDLVREHEVLLDKGQHFLDSLQLAKTGDLRSLGLLESQGRDYVALLRSHIDKEEEHVLPLASKVLRPEDWAQIDTAMAYTDDPIFGQAVAKVYGALCNYLTRQER
ncbi:MAG: hemerythrin domain-containing protein, partial [Acidiferrobacterales bacterium]